MARSGKSTGKATGEVQLVGDKVAAREIARLRAGFNTAIADQDFDAIGSVLSEDALLIPGDDAPLIQGRAAQLEAWGSIFSQCQDVGYLRSPARIEVSDDGHLAAEQGRWTGGWISDGLSIRYVGRYLAKWHLVDLEWKIAAETFVTIKRSSGS
ncbi:nuclear transport factor 2 family protein [Maricaulis sp.]|uniref:YybH family protein n=1 Tax=Maricaulis sp. TaxID=1486257 RepID=UPI0026370B47|nr:nuclear transport factor 2 family protein [Maricaulis sp.]